MGSLLRLAVFILVLGAIAAGTSALLVQERQREHFLERMLTVPATVPESPSVPVGEADPAVARDRAAEIAQLRAWHTRTQRSLGLFGGLALVGAILLAIVPTRTPTTPPEPGHRQTTRTEMRGMESLARTTAAQSIELDQERDARHRSEQDLNLQQILANRALQEKIRLGRDLHDGIVQTLYATGLVLETATQQLAATPPQPTEAAQLLERAKTTLNAAIRETRRTIGDLAPDAIDEQSFADAVATLLDHLGGGHRSQSQLALSPDLPVFTEPARTELLQIIRESASNALRHGAATHLDIAFAPADDDRLLLTIRDDGRGFDPTAVTRGHGLNNLAARARTLAATLRIDAAPGRGTCIALTLPNPIRQPEPQNDRKS